MKTHPLISSDWLKEHLNDPNLVILDATIPKAGGVLPASGEDIQIPGTRFFDLKGVFSDKSSGLPNMMPSPDVFETGCRQLGINQDSKVVVYDRHGIYSAPRVWWMFKVMGHDQVQVLDGGFPNWLNQGLPTEARNDTSVPEGNFSVNYKTGQVKSATDVLENIDRGDFVVLDARSGGRFNGTDPEPRKGLKGGHIPNSLSLPHTVVHKNGKFLPIEELKPIIEGLNLGDKPLTFSCGSGITACVILLAADMVLDNDMMVYDGSWTEWGDPDKDFPVDK